MQTIIVANFFVFMLVGTIFVFIGLDIKKWTSWLLGLYGFLSGILFSFIRENADISTRLLLGAILGVGVMFVGAMVRRNRQIYTKEDVQSARDNFNKNHATAKRIREEKARGKK